MAGVVIIDYGSGNLRSVAKAFEHVANNVQVVSKAADIAQASHIVLPGVGAFADCMNGLSAIPGMLDSLNKEVLEKGKNFLGICVGMQMLFELGHEYGTHKGLGWIKGEVVALQGNLKIPHMGWNELEIKQESPLLAGIENGAHAYFVHSFHAKLANSSQLLATVQYGQQLTAVVGKDNIYGTQFHPEKSQQTGLRIINNFVKL